MFLPLIIFGLVALSLLAAAITFTLTATIMPFMRSAIPAPIAATILSPCLVLLAFPVFLVQHHPFLVSPQESQWTAWALYALITALAIAICAALAKIATLICRAIFEFLPPWLESRFNLQRQLLLQLALLFGGSLSLLVLAGFFGWLTFLLRENLALALTFGIAGFAASAACARALLRLPDPERYKPAPLPDSIKKLIFRERTPAA